MFPFFLRVSGGSLPRAYNPTTILVEANSLGPFLPFPLPILLSHPLLMGIWGTAPGNFLLFQMHLGEF